MGEYSFIGEAALTELAMTALRAAVPKMAADLVADAQGGAPIVTGALKSSIHVDGIDDGGASVIATVATGVEYAVPVHEGSVPHWIEPKDANGFLFWPGAGHPVQRVFHPGAAPNKYLEGPLLAGRPTYLAVLAAAGRGVF